MTLAELALLSGVSSNVQTQLTGLEDDKQDSITGAATTVTSANLTSNRVLMSNATGKIKVSNMSSTTFDYLDMTSSVQTQLNGKHPEITTSAPLSQSRVDGLASTLSGKQPLIGSSTNLVVNKVTFGSGVDSIEFQGDLSGYATTGALTSGLATKQATGSYATTTNWVAMRRQGPYVRPCNETSDGFMRNDHPTGWLCDHRCFDVRPGNETSDGFIRNDHQLGGYATTGALTSGLATKQATGSYATTPAWLCDHRCFDVRPGNETSDGFMHDHPAGWLCDDRLTSGLATKQATGSYATTTNWVAMRRQGLTSGLATKQATGSYATTTQLGGYATTGPYVRPGNETSFWELCDHQRFDIRPGNETRNNQRISSDSDFECDWIVDSSCR